MISEELRRKLLSIKNITYDDVVKHTNLPPVLAIEILASIIYHQYDESNEYFENFIKYMEWIIHKNILQSSYLYTYLYLFLEDVYFICGLFYYPQYFTTFLNLYREKFNVEDLVRTIKNFIKTTIEQTYICNDSLKYNLSKKDKRAIYTSYKILKDLSTNIDLTFINDIYDFYDIDHKTDALDKTYIEYLANYTIFCLYNNYIKRSFYRFTILCDYCEEIKSKL